MAQVCGRFILSLCLFAAGALLLLQSYFGEKIHAAGAEFGPMFYPRILLWLWVLLSGAMTVRAFRSGAPAVPVENWKSFLWSTVLTLGLGFLMEPVGFIVTSVVFCYLTPYMQGYRNHRVLVPFSLLYTAFVWYLFNKLLYIFLPEMYWLEGIL